MNTRIAAQRLGNHRLTQPGPRRVADVVAWLGAVQAQEYPAAKWALALRMPPDATDAKVETAFNKGEILRTHVMRPTWHFVAAPDIHWMLELTRGRVQRALTYAHRHFGLDLPTRTRARKIFERALSDGRSLTCAELGEHLARAGLVMKGTQLWLATIHSELEGVMCSGPQRGKQSTYALLASRAPVAKPLSRDEALAKLTERYFRSHGPATVRDFVWWSGLTAADTRRALEICKGRHEVVDAHTYWTLGDPQTCSNLDRSVCLLPIYDEYLVAYRDLDAVPRKAGSRGTLQQAIVAGGQIVGTWKSVRRGDEVVVTVATDRRLTGVKREALVATAARYGRFLNLPVTLS